MSQAKLLRGVIPATIMAMILVIMLSPNNASATKFDELKDKVELPRIGNPWGMVAHRLVPEGYFVLNRAYGQPVRHSIHLPGSSVMDWNATITFTGTTGKIDIVDTIRITSTGFYVGDAGKYRIYKVTDGGTLQEVAFSTGKPDGNGLLSIQSTSFDVSSFEEGLYLLQMFSATRWRLMDEEDHDYDYIPFEIIDSELLLGRRTYFVDPGDNLTIVATFENDDASVQVTASLITDLEERTLVPLQVNKIDQKQYAIEYNVPEEAVEDTINILEVRAFYGNFEVYKRSAVILIGSEGNQLPPPELIGLCPFILNPPWALAGQTVTVGCYDNPMDTYTITGGRVWIPNVPMAPLTNQGNGTFTASLVAPSTEGVVPVLYELDVQDASGKSFRVNGSQNMIVTTSPSAMYCPPPAEGVTSTPGGGERVGVRLFR